ncbi:hypothetical protein [Microbacterium sp.]|uniref:hypothetical protein n=1 Tax=Microbacterium sp. TaxID=51671 RepID=UPI003F9AEB43
MAFAFIGKSARELLALPDDTSAVQDADRVVAVLRTDYERWSRWLVGLAAYLVFIVGLFVAVGMIAAMIAPGVLITGIDIVIVCVSLVVAAVSGWMLVRLWLTGRRMLRAAVAWMRLPYARGARARGTGGWVSARTVNFEPRIFVRVMTASLALLVAVAGIALFIRDVVEGTNALSVAALIIGVVSLASGLGQAGGVMRLVSGASEADPVWVRIRGMFRA